MLWLTGESRDIARMDLNLRARVSGQSRFNVYPRAIANDGGPSLRTFYEFFAGGGMARAGLGEGWHCAFANDFDPMKAAAYRANWGEEDLVCEDVAKITTSDLPGRPDLVWGSFPCQDLSLAGVYKGLGSSEANEHTRSGTFWPFWSLLEKIRAEGRGPKVVILENVYGAITSNDGRDFRAIATTLSNSGYVFGALVVDARHFVAQSRPRLFIVAVDKDLDVPSALVAAEPSETWVPSRLRSACALLPENIQKDLRWWALPQSKVKPKPFSSLIEDEPDSVRWHDAARTKELLSMMSPLHLQKVEAAKKLNRKIVGGVYRRTRPAGAGLKAQRAEVRFDEIAGCLRTPAGGSSRQIILVVEGQRVRSRLLSAREAARLMGLEDDYILPKRYNDAYHIAGDGVVVPVVSHIARNLVEPILDYNDKRTLSFAAE